MSFQKYQRIGAAELRPYVVAEDLTKISVSDPDRALLQENPDEFAKGFIARNPENKDDQWYVSMEYFQKNFNPKPITVNPFNDDPKPWDYEREVVGDKVLRMEGDALIQRVKCMPPSRERSLAVTKMQEAIMWLGMDLKRLGEANPYPSSKDASTGTTIEPTADNLKM